MSKCETTSNFETKNGMRYSLKGIDDLADNYKNNLMAALEVDSPNILAIGLGLDEVCNFRCIYCYAGAPSDEDLFEGLWTKQRSKLNTQDYENLVAQASQLGAKSTVICGNGEPFLSKHILPIIDKSHEMGMTSIIFTNASVFTEEKLCWRIHNISCNQMMDILSKKNVSLMIKCDSVKPTLYEQITKTNYKKFLKSVETLERHFLQLKTVRPNEKITNIGVSMVINKQNFIEIEDIARFANSRGFQFVCKFVSFMGNALQNKDWFFTPEEANERYAETLRFVDKRETMLVDDKYCLINQLGASIDLEGIPLGCLSSRAIEVDRPLNVRSVPLEEIVLTRKRLTPPKEGDCPKKAKWYSFKV